jgi:anthranilate phosphoribosyltransferase
VDPEIVEAAIAEIGIGFLFAPKYHGAMKYAARAREEVGLRSIFNMLGPLTNPAGTRRQLLGVFAPELTEMFAQALQRLGAKRVLVVHGHDGLDEISVCAPTRICELDNGQITTYDLSPETYFGRRAGQEEVAGGSPDENAAIAQDILSGDKGARRDIVLINAGAAFMAAGLTEDIGQGIEMAKKSIDSGAALDKLQALITFNAASRR